MVAPKRLVAPQFTSAMAASDAGIRASSASTERGQLSSGTTTQLNTNIAMTAVIITDHSARIAGNPDRRVGATSQPFMVTWKPSMLSNAGRPFAMR